ncbi:hypothetical protein C0993_004741 [Termitomyces sp. T159_Od127]|nr:hypothetical protein C0993_004741 [Termitomyces sp. T159_Od127]
MASDAAAAAELAIAFVVESSLTVAGDWPLIIADYVSPILRRLYESSPSAKRRLAFVTYATADTVPSPLLCRRPFCDSKPVTAEMRESPASLGIGATNSGGTRGMAALEGLVAAIELFEVYIGAVGRGRVVLSHIIHIASAAPDASVHPRFNDSPKYDDMTWESMADEMRNRNIGYNTINLVPNLKRFAELHAKAGPLMPPAPCTNRLQASKDAPKPFFAIRAPHSVLLAGLPSSSSAQKAPAAPAPAKRPGDVHTTPDPKRARLAPPADVSPNAQAPSTPASQPKPSPLLPAQPKPQPRTPVLPPALAPAPSMPAAPAPAPAPPFPNAAPNPKESFLNVLRNLEMQIRALRMALQNAQSVGDALRVQSLTLELGKKQAMQQRAKEYVMKVNQQAQAQAQAAQAQAHLRSLSGGGGSQEGVLGPPPLAPAVSSPGQPPMEQQQQQQALATMLHKRTASGSGTSGPGPGPGPGPSMQPQGLMPPQGNANLVAQMHQMQKMVEQQQRARSMQNMQQQQQQQNMPGAPNAVAVAGPPPPPIKSPNSVWQGSLVFSVTDAQGIKKDSVIWVMGKVSSAPEDSRIDTWPSAMQLSLANKPAVPAPDLQAWIQGNRAVLCLFQPQTNGVPDPAANQANYKALVAFLHERNEYAVAGWTLPSGDQGNNILFFPVKADGLAAACFPLTGLPELPVPSRRPAQVRNLLNVDFNNPETRARLQALSPEQREHFVKAFKAQRALQMQQQQMVNAQGGGMGAVGAMGAMGNVNVQQQQQQQQIPDAAFGGNVHPPNYGGMGMMNAMGVGQQSPGMMGGMNRPVGNGNGMRGAMPGANINYEMMQSFMTRNPDGGGGMGP